MRKKIFGGIHPESPWPPPQHHLEQSGWYAEVAPGLVRLPMRQGPGSPCVPVVQQHETVRVGQLLGENREKIGAHVHASISGTVTQIADLPTANGTALCVEIENDGTDTPYPPIAAVGDSFSLNAEEISKAIRRAGIIGMGGAGFPTHIKLQPQKPIDTIVVNGCESEPVFAADDALMQQNAGDILAGCRAAMKMTGAQHCIIGIETNKPTALAAMQRMVGNHSEIHILSLRHLYPQGGEKQLVQAACGREIPIGGLPADVGVVVLNVATCAAISETLQTGTPLVRRVATITGDVKRPRNLRFPIGTLAADMIDLCGGFSGTPSKVILGGPMMGQTLARLDVPLTKGSGGILVVNDRHDHLFHERPCIRCNRCVRACPMRLEPLFLDRYARKNRLDICESFQAQSCINCGCCTYVCPARRRLAETIVSAKNSIAQAQKEARS